MVKREWGAKHTCMDCVVKFYDLHRSPIACPRCGSVTEIETARPSRRRQPAQPEAMPPANGELGGAALETAAGDEAIGDDIDDDEDNDEDDDALVEDLDDAETTLPAV